MLSDWRVSTVDDVISIGNPYDTTPDTVPNVTLDLNGYTLSGTWADKGYEPIQVCNGKLTVKDSSVAKSGKISSSTTYTGTLAVYGNSEVKIESGTIENTANRNAIFTATPAKLNEIYHGGDAEVSVTGGKIDGELKTESRVVSGVTGTPEIAVSGGSFSEAVPEEYCADGFIPTANEDGTYGVKNGSYVAEVNGVKYETLAEAVAAADTGDTVKLLADIDLDEQIAVSKGITIDGQGIYTIKATKKLVGTNNKLGMFYRVTYAGGTLTFRNVTLDGNGVSKIFLNEGGAGETVFDRVTSKNGAGIAYGAGIHISGGGSHATIKNSTLTGSNGTYELNETNYYAANDLWVGGNVDVTVENSTIGTVFVNTTSANTAAHGHLTIKGTETIISYLSGDNDVTDKNGDKGSTITIENGNFETIADKGVLKISGGTFANEIKPEWCADGFIPTANEDGTYGVKSGSYVAEVNGVKYETLAEALTALTANGTLTLLADLTDIGTISLPAGAVIEGGNHTVSGNSCFYANANGATFKNVNFVDIANGKKLTAIYGEGLSGKLTVTGCLFDNCEYEALQITPVANAEIVITGNTFKTDNTDGVYQTRYVHIESRANVDFSATVTQNVMYDQIKGVNGAEQSCGALEVYYFKDASKINVKENYIQYPELNCILKGYGTNVGEMVYPLYEDPNLATLTGTPVAAIKTTYEGTYYMTLQDAIDAAVSGDTVQLLTDITQEDGIIIEKNLTLNLNYKTFTVTNGSNTNNRNIKVIGNANLTVRNGSMVAASNATNDGGAYGTVRFESSGNLTMSNVTLTNSRKYGLNVKLLNGTASFTKVTINSTYGGGVEVGGASATFTNCNFNQSGDDGYVSSCIATCDGGTATVKSGTYNSENYCLYVYNSGGTINVVNGKFVSGADKSVLRVDTSDSAVSDSVINVSNGSFTGTIATGGSSTSKVNDINISGGTFSNEVAKEYCADGFVPVSTEDGKYTVTESSDVFGTSFYARNLDITMDGHYRVVLFAGIDSLNYEKVGFKITAGDITVTYDSKNVYRSVTISGTQYSAGQFDVFRLFGLAIQFPEVWDNTPIDYQPFAVDLDGNVIYGEIYTIDDIYTK